jgi:hypothetical protein
MRGQIRPQVRRQDGNVQVLPVQQSRSPSMAKGRVRARGQSRYCSPATRRSDDAAMMRSAWATPTQQEVNLLDWGFRGEERRSRLV